jgi:Putative esterase
MSDPVTQFSVTFDGSVAGGPLTGRLLLIISKSVDRPYIVAPGPAALGGVERGLEPRLQAGTWKNRVPFFGTYQQGVPYFSPWVGSAPFFGVDVDAVGAGTPMILDESAPGFPPLGLRDIPAGDYFVQAVLNVYSQFDRADGHVIWAHDDQWEGQHWNSSPGNLVSEVASVHLDPQTGYDIPLKLTSMLPPAAAPADTDYVRHLKFESPLLTRFWGRPTYLGATVLLPRGYDEHPDERYPVIYNNEHFNLGAPFGFSPAPVAEGIEERYMRSLRGLENGHDFYRAWTSDDFPRAVIVTMLHPTPYFDSSYCVNSANVGPYGDAIMTELIPALEDAFRISREPRERLLTGGSTGGWVSLALQIYHPTEFGGTWAFAPDSVDFRRYGLFNIYADANAYTAPNREWLVPERTFYRSPDGQPEITLRQMSRLEAASGSHGRSGEQLDVWHATFGPVGSDGYPRPLWDQETGEVDRDVASHWREQGYDLRAYLDEHWAEIGRDLAGKIRVFCADMDDYFLNLGVYALEECLENTEAPYYGGSFTYGRPLDGHVWHPMNHGDLVRTMLASIGARPRDRRHFASRPSAVAFAMGNDHPGS